MSVSTRAIFLEGLISLLDDASPSVLAATVATFLLDSLRSVSGRVLC